MLFFHAYKIMMMTHEKEIQAPSAMIIPTMDSKNRTQCASRLGGPAGYGRNNNGPGGNREHG